MKRRSQPSFRREKILQLRSSEAMADSVPEYSNNFLSIHERTWCSLKASLPHRFDSNTMAFLSNGCENITFMHGTRRVFGRGR